MHEVFTHKLISKKSLGFAPKFGGTSFLVHAQDQAVSDAIEDERDQPLAGDGIFVTSTFMEGKHFTDFILTSSKSIL